MTFLICQIRCFPLPLGGDMMDSIVEVSDDSTTPIFVGLFHALFFRG